jgi:[acyl-carrier-protein] S-malonyltransferase
VLVSARGARSSSVAPGQRDEDPDRKGREQELEVLAFTFPGQGSQRPGMGQAWRDHPSWEVVEESSEVVGRDLGHLLLQADQAELTDTANAQLATLVASLVALDAVERLGLVPVACAGHSLGEYTALIASGCIALEDGVRLVAERGQAMRDAAEENPGTMAAVLGADDDAVDAACRRAEGDVWLANYNAPGQVVIAGTHDAVEEAGRFARELGARKVMPLQVAGAFHTPLMAPARSRLRKALSETTFFDADTPVIANVDARPHQAAAEWPGLLSAQLLSPVRWRQSVDALVQRGVTCVAELGPGGVLTGLARRCAPEMTALAVSAPEHLDLLVEAASNSVFHPASAAVHGGEHLYTSERVVVSPRPGVFNPSVPGVPGPDGLSPTGATAFSEPALHTPEGGARVSVGDVVGHVGGETVCTAFAGQLVAYLAHAGERVAEGQPLAWVRIPQDDGT